MRKIKFLWMLLVAAASFALASCSDDKVELPDGAVTEKDCTDAKTVSAASGEFKIAFTVVGAWKAVSSDEAWCTIMPANGPAGSNKVSVSFTENKSESNRKATIAIQVDGYKDAVLCTLIQNGTGGGSYNDVNQWVLKYMKEAYMWNESIDGLVLDETKQFEKFLTDILEGVASQKDGSGRPINYDDGHWSKGVREYFYSNISLSETSRSTRAGEKYTDTGILDVINGYLSEDPYVGGLVVMGVAPGSSADQAGLKRGHMITHVDGEEFTRDLSTAKKKAMAEKLVLGPEVKVVANEVSGGVDEPWVLTPLPEMTLSATTYTDPAIYKRSVVEVGDKKVAYLLYMGFATAFDQDLFEAFDYFKAQGAEELILDLRYNGGGEVRSSTLLATLIAGSDYKDQVYVKTTYNATRTAKGETGGVYRIGNATVADGDGRYAPLEEALNHSLGLKRLYVICSVNTASASELIINGLRGIGLEVRLVGTQTNGKNVGMEGYVDKKVGDSYYNFFPVTFYSENAVGFRDYSDGFTPDVIFDDANYYPGDYGTEEDGYFLRAASWIRTGEKPVSSGVAAKTRSMVVKQRYREGFPQRHPTGSLIILGEE